jgi:hypothetical protein
MRELHGEGWIDCPPGVLDQLAARIRGRRRASRRANTFAAVIASLVLTGVLGLGSVLASRALGYYNFPFTSSDSYSGQSGPPSVACPPPPKGSQH